MLPPVLPRSFPVRQATGGISGGKECHHSPMFVLAQSRSPRGLAHEPRLKEDSLARSLANQVRGREDHPARHKAPSRRALARPRDTLHKASVPERRRHAALSPSRNSLALKVLTPVYPIGFLAPPGKAAPVGEGHTGHSSWETVRATLSFGATSHRTRGRGNPLPMNLPEVMSNDLISTRLSKSSGGSASVYWGKLLDLISRALATRTSGRVRLATRMRWGRHSTLLSFLSLWWTTHAWLPPSPVRARGPPSPWPPRMSSTSANTDLGVRAGGCVLWMKYMV
jgi:hypothetical protein